MGFDIINKNASIIKDLYQSDPLKAKEIVQQLKSHERKLLLKIIRGTYSGKEDSSSVSNLADRIVAIQKEDYPSVRSEGFFANFSRGFKNRFLKRPSSDHVLNELSKMPSSKTKSMEIEEPPKQRFLNFPRTPEVLASDIQACKKHEVTNPDELEKIIKAMQPENNELIDFKIFYNPNKRIIHYHSNQGVSYEDFEEVRQNSKFVHAILYKEEDRIYIKLTDVYIAIWQEIRPWDEEAIRNCIYKGFK